MALKAPVWELKRSKDKKQPWFAHLKGRNSRVVVTTETYRSRQSVLKAIAVVDPDGKFEIRDLSK